MLGPVGMLAAVGAAQLLTRAAAQTECTNTLTPSSTPVVADGYSIQVIAQDLARPRSLQFDTSGNLLVASGGGGGIINLKLKDSGGTCLEVEDQVELITDATKAEINHGIALSEDGNRLYASSNTSVFAWEYDAEARKVGAEPPAIVVTGMENGGHSTRTLLRSRAFPNQLVAVRGSDGNIDLEAADIESGHCHLRAFDMNETPEGGYDFGTQGKLLGWGLRNSVGLDEHPDTGEIWTVENSVDNAARGGEDVHQDNPGEEMNRHGSVESSEGLNYGYPYCVAAWDVEGLPDNEGFEVGDQFAHDIPETNKTDEFCADKTKPRLTFNAHTAPLDIKFNGGGEAFISFHGSWYVYFLAS